MKQRQEVVTILFIFSLALLVRIWFAAIALTGQQEFVMGDDDDYHRLAISLAQTGQLADHGQLTAYRMPFFPLTLAFFYYIFGESPQIGHLFLVVLSALICVGVYLLGRELFSPKVGMIASLITIIDLPLIFYSRFLLTETLFTFLVLCSLLALERLRKTQAEQWAVIAGSLLALSTLTRANFAPFVLFALAWMIFTQRELLVLRNAFIVVALVGSLWTTWIVRNYLDFGAFIPFTTQGGNAYYGIYHDLAADHSRGIYYGDWVWLHPPVPESTIHQWSEVELDRLQKEKALAWIRTHQEQAIQVALMQPVHFWRPDFYEIPAVYILFIVSSVIGFIIALRQGNQGIMLWAILAGVMTLLTIVSVGVPRFRVALHPLLAVLAALAFVTGWQKIVAKWGDKPVFCTLKP